MLQRCGGKLQATRGIEAGHVFKLGAKYSDAVGATFLDRDGTAKPLIMGSYGIGTGRLMSCIIEQHHDDKGIIWPVSVARGSEYLYSGQVRTITVPAAGSTAYRRVAYTRPASSKDDSSRDSRISALGDCSW